MDGTRIAIAKAQAPTLVAADVLHADGMALAAAKALAITLVAVRGEEEAFNRAVAEVEEGDETLRCTIIIAMQWSRLAFATSPNLVNSMTQSAREQT